ncbi:DUF6417 family protein [Streptomyces sp. CoH27]|uniref:DUF6417 family protein n=1 Tax=Streptomyces sp. CoH27 TaxID=2875763 RepID=UPI001CD32C19|nr:DUF6417 family protein [Streptomyces sp. CoH27]
MRGSKSCFEALGALREREVKAAWGWVLSSDVLPQHQQAVETAAGQGLAEVADREMRAELSALEGHPILWAARLTGLGHDVLTYAEASPAPARHRAEPMADEQLVELRPAEMDALRVYVGAAERLRVAPAGGLVERVRRAVFDGPANRWSLCLTGEQMESVAYAFYPRAVCGSVAEANRFAPEYDVVVRMDRSTGSLRSARLH